MDWLHLLSPIRLGMENYHDRNRDHRNQFQRDYDRLIFSASFRRLQNKTQVFPLPGSVFVHNRLTHSLEVASVGRSLASNVAWKHSADGLSAYMEEIGSVVSAACLAHDMGNPPFGHSGEKAIASFFSEGKGEYLQKELSTDEWYDLIRFDGNANAFRLLTHQFAGKRVGGFVLTYTTLAAIVKYPYPAIYCPSDKQKFGFFTTEKEHYQKIASYLGIERKNDLAQEVYMRHPLVYLVEAADDICYQIMDLEDAHKLKIIGTEETMALMMDFFDNQRKAKIEKNMGLVTDINEKIAYLRSSVIGALIDACTVAFLDNEQAILDGAFDGALIKHISPHLQHAYQVCTQRAFEKIYRSEEVLDVELAGYKIIQTLLEVFVQAVQAPDKAYSRQLIHRIPAQYQIDAQTTYGRIQAVVDYISGMTDVYALDLYKKITGIDIVRV